MKKKDLKNNAFLMLAISIAIIIVINIISNKLFFRFDLTKNKSYTLSSLSKDIVSNMNDRLEIRAYFSDNLPAPYNNLRRDIKDFLSDYRSYSKGNLNYTFISPGAEGENSEMDKAAQKDGIRPVQLQVTDNDKFEVKNAYLGMILSYQGKTEVIPVIQSVDDFEYIVTSKIKNLISDSKKKIGFLQGEGEYDYTKFNSLMSVLNEQYKVEKIEAGRNKPIPQDISALVIMGPKQEFPEWIKYQIDQYIMNGGNVAFLLNKVVPNFQQQIAIGDIVKDNLDDMLGNYGAKINQDLVRDLKCSKISKQSEIQGMYVQIDYPFFPVITNINRDIAAFRNIPYVALAFASTLDLSFAPSKGIDAKPLLTTSDKSGKAEGFFILSEGQFSKLDQRAVDTLFNHKGGYVVGATLNGKFKSLFDGKPIPSDTAATSAPVQTTTKTQCDKESKLIVVGDGDFANEEQRVPRENLIFFLNMVDYLADDVGMSDIRSKKASDPPLDDSLMTSGSKFFFKVFNAALPPVIVILIGIFFFASKSKRKKGN